MEGLNKTGQGPALSDNNGPRTMKEDYGPSEGGSLQRGVAYVMKMEGDYPSDDTNSETKGLGQMPPQHYKGSADMGTRWG